MRCRTHPYESAVGVCAACLRGRLLALAAAQNQAPSLPPPPPPPEPVPLFPRSVSPYVCPRKSDAASGPGPWRHPSSRLFFRTPQVGPGTGFEEGDIGFQIRRRRSSKLSALAALFGGHRQHQHDGSEEKGADGGKERKHGSWLAGIMPRARGRRKEEPPTESPRPPRRRSSRVISNRGLSPVRCSYEGSEEGGSVADSPWRPSPMRKTPCRRLLGGAGAGVSGFAVCISPLVRPSPARNHHRGPPDAPALSGELRPSPLHQPSAGSSLHHCRSWKLADGGRFR
ncbi:unnamed protein product [Triticum aestivum]|uniref:Uncharacterized protein n=2 Tax=Triticinae TaxID=1648030 RepID=A0A453CXH8_AEGTS|nr:uncharacterized protein LOC109734094 [Aegilops tauschii subsp. strangulata]XP_044328774.1 uncharacterized protein LOC123049990 [Triticum aestivum]SPT19894.1 unnamed protein product [Triticum aestivum]